MNEDARLFWALKEEEGFSHASGAYEDIPTYSQIGKRPRLEPRPFRLQGERETPRDHQIAWGPHPVIRIGLNSTRLDETGRVLREFDTATRQTHGRVEITATGAFALREATGGLLGIGQAGEVFAFTSDEFGIWVVGPDGISVGVFPGPILIVPEDGSLLQILSIRRRNLNVAGSPFEPPRYRGLVEVSRDPSSTRMRVVNVLGVEEYLWGVIPNEMPASFHLEALKAQAVAARTYALANIGRFADRGFDLDDSTLSQVYRGVLVEHPRTTQAVVQTSGLVLSVGGELVPAFYSSSTGGHTEDNEWIFNSPTDVLPGTNAHPALRAIHDGPFPVPVDLLSDEGALMFYRETWDHYDNPRRSGNPFYRWVETRSAEQIAERVRAVFGFSIGRITNLVVMLRSPSGRIAQLQIVGEEGSVVLQGWRPLRDFFQLRNSPSALQLVRESDGAVRRVDLYGGGWGHNVGMSQYGAHGRARAGQTFVEILRAYYTGVDVGPLPMP